MSSINQFVVYRKKVKIHPTEIPKSTYVAETFMTTKKQEPIKAREYFETLAIPKAPPKEASPVPIPKFENKTPEFDSVDYRTTNASLERDLYIMKSLQKKEEQARGSDPKEFLAWQKEMRQKDEEELKAAIEARRTDLNNCRRKAMKAKKKTIEERLEVGKQMRLTFSEEIANVREEIERERQQIIELKNQRDLLPVSNVEKVKQRKIAESREVRKQVREDLKLASKLRAEKTKQIKENAIKVRDQLKNHTNRHGDAFKGKIEITDTKFLAALTDEEAQALVDQHAEEKRAKIETQIEQHRKAKEAKMDKLIQMLNEVTAAREQKEEEHERLRLQKQEEERKELEKKQMEEEEKIIELEKKLEKKRKQRIQEAQEMEEHTRQIDARTRYLALNKKALQTKTFQNQQDGKLRAAKERQTLLMSENGVEMKKSKKQYSNAELTALKGLLGM
ncbi:hypothetical protein TVAG_386530 [Trichomonas vaginalis G3]|uniref:Uncharacterized protein n=1 Tax=Trichomonas vaginalis (strain ATCC PRA-98 / G3) TaxID=412133 RepID=A2FSF0_TRIV3|nr:hypothetical protein TVAGG3_0157800 [Trichomonas vaginalis G3]EAX92179.1 hypothetical protein TVAG_386530 [Trichomonas vaginalis G3]KAI5547655.1 hypothetical protein TVAGG3_0157800 [Trichomonas vaginalis G3]|eukprot:XP_001305109.1 hypothetical protein [Trichomonas vaginalis G3]